MSINKLEVFKFAARLIVGAGTTTISNAIIKNNVAPANPLQHVSVGVASVVIGSMASSATAHHTDSQIDAIVDRFKTVRAQIDENLANNVA